MVCLWLYDYKALVFRIMHLGYVFKIAIKHYKSIIRIGIRNDSQVITEQIDGHKAT